MIGFLNALRSDKTRRTAEFTGAWDGARDERALRQGMTSGMVAGTRVATPGGWRPVEAVAAGAKVLTLDARKQRVVRVTRGILGQEAARLPRRMWPLAVEAGALGNQRAMTLLPEQAVMIESDAAEALWGDPFALIAAHALEGVAGITRVPPQPMIEVVTLHFETDQVVFANIGALFLCPATGEGEAVLPGGDSAYSGVSGDEAAVLVACMERPAPQTPAPQTAAPEMA